jgi:formylglycine-generating enzyme required for sulfatase activity
VEGEYCPFVGHRCVEWLNEQQDRCQRYAEPPICEGKLRALRVCVDRYEYPNQKGVYPAVMVSFVEAQAACEAEHKRLCNESEWTLACEGNERLPYPYGYERDPSACNIDRPYGFPDLGAFEDETRVAAEIARLDQRVASGSMSRCRSPYGVYDMTGNVDEWVVNENPKPAEGVDVSGLKGGYFGPIRARCRPMTTAHNRWFRFYQVGFRCCSDPLSDAQASSGLRTAVAQRRSFD